jgi:hypothetical protein
VPIRLATAILFLAAATVAAVTGTPSDLPAIALGQVAVYRVEVLLALVYGGLLLLTPLFHGLGGRLPIEISHRGAKWQAQAPMEKAEEKIERLEGELDSLKPKDFIRKASDELG